MDKLTTNDPFRQLMEEWDSANRPGVAPHIESPDWQMYESDRERFLADAARSAAWAPDDATAGPDGSDLEWLAEQAHYYRGVGSDVARLAADALEGVAAAMAGAGHFDAGGYRHSLAERGIGLAEALPIDRGDLITAAA